MTSVLSPFRRRLAGLRVPLAFGGGTGALRAAPSARALLASLRLGAVTGVNPVTSVLSPFRRRLAGLRVPLAFGGGTGVLLLARFALRRCAPRFGVNHLFEKPF